MQVRTATRADIAAIAEVLALAFADDPVINWMLPGARGSTKLFATLARYFHPVHEIAFDGSAVQGAALWEPPGHVVSTLALTRALPGLVAAMGPRIQYGQLLEETFAAVRPSEPHWYLSQIGTDPAARGKGAGSALMTARLDAIDGPVYLESSKETNVPFYEKFGFKVVQEVRLPKDGPKCWTMWRS